MDINLFFDAVYLINLPHRQDRLQQHMKSRDKNKVHHQNYIIFEAVDGKKLELNGWEFSPGALGCLESHLRILKDAKQKGYEKILVFEDDFKFVKGFNQKMTDALNELPTDWDMLYLHSSHYYAPTPYSKHLDKCNGALTTVAYGVNRTIFDTLINLIELRKRQVDVEFASLHAHMNCYSTKKHLCFHYNSFSDVNHMYAKNYLGFVERNFGRIRALIKKLFS